jgi:DMSO/TMAO reductase YedYZ molybdopterin-dependent catalytic subunit
VDLERAHIFRLLETGDNFVKYATPGGEARAQQRARKRYERALELAQRRGDPALIEQVQLRIDDITRRSGVLDGASDTSTSGRGANPDLVARSPQGAAENIGAAVGEAEGGTGQVVVPLPAPGARRVPPGQRVTRGWPVLHEGLIPRFDRQNWRFRMDGACRRAYELTYDELLALPNVELRSDFHCVTGWSKLDNVWRGVQTKLLLARAEPSPEASHVVAHDGQGYTANVPMEVLMADDAIVTWSHGGEDLAPEHGYPLRLLVPRLYGWKSVKWVERFELLTRDRRGFWETRGYHNHADPWNEERYSYQEA